MFDVTIHCIIKYIIKATRVQLVYYKINDATQ